MAQPAPAPAANLEQLAGDAKLDVTSAAFAAHMDERDPLRAMRANFHVPLVKQLPSPPVDAAVVSLDEECVYLCGNSLGLQPKRTKEIVNEELDNGVFGHFDDSARPWVSIEETVRAQSARIVGAKTEEVAIMNTLTVNLHLLMVPFYRPKGDRYKILLENKAFPSDHHAVASQIKFHGYDPADAMVLATAREGETTLRDDDICQLIEDNASSLALVMLSGVQFYTGQYFDLERIAKTAHKHGITVGFDLAHAAGNVELHLHDWGVDFACWCSYKYINAGPGGIAGAFIHERHAHDFDLPRFAGWWGVDPATRFQMGYDYKFVPGVAGFQLSNPPVLQTVSLLASLELFEKTSMAELRAKSFLLTGFLELLLQRELASDGVTIITPSEPSRRGCQLSLLFGENVLPVFNELEKRGVVCDKREPNVLRIAPVPMYNSFADVRRFVDKLKAALAAAHSQ